MNIFIVVFTFSLIVTTSCVYGLTLAQECAIVTKISGVNVGENCCEIGNSDNLPSIECLIDGHITNLRLGGVTGPIPEDIKYLTNLYSLHIGGEDGNRLTGEIPDWIGNLKELTSLYLNRNLLTGSIPDSFNKLEKLNEIHLDDNCIDCNALWKKYPDGKVGKNPDYNLYCSWQRTEGCPVDISDCPELYENKNSCNGEDTPETYCYSAKNRQLIGFSSSNSDKNECDKAFDLTESKVNILNLDGKIETADLINGDINIVNTVIYDCDENTCQRVNGLIKHIDGNIDEFLYVGSTDDSSINLCSSDNSDNEYLVYDKDKEDAKVYKCNVSKGYAKIFSGENGKNVCVDGTSVIWADRKEALCNAKSDCTNYYDCTDGECILSRKNSITVRDNDCKPSTGVENCSEGYHLTNNDGTALATSEGKLWYCDYENCKKLENYAGYFRNADDSNKPNILCVNNEGSNKCEKVEINSESCSSIGEVITKTQGGDEYALCTSTSGSGLLLSESKSKQYMVAIDKTNGLYEIKPNTDAEDENTQFYLVVLVDTDANVRVVREIKPIRYRYTNGRDDHLIYDRSAAQDAKNGDDENAICKADHDPFEYKLDQWTEALQTNAFADFYIVDN